MYFYVTDIQPRSVNVANIGNSANNNSKGQSLLFRHTRVVHEASG